MHQRSVKCFALVLGIAALCARARADYTETFENNTNAGGWFFTTNPIRINRIEPTGGHPGAWFHGTENAGAPTVQTTQGLSSPFTGDYAARDVTRFSVDVQVLNGDNDRREFTLALYDYADGDVSHYLTAYTSLRPIPNSGSGWRPYTFKLPADNASIPATWSMFRGDGATATSSDWTSLMSHVDQVQLMWGEFGFAYPLHTVWDLGIDNVKITDATITGVPVPEPALISPLLLTAAIISCRRRHSRTRVANNRNCA